MESLKNFESQEGLPPVVAETIKQAYEAKVGNTVRFHGGEFPVENPFLLTFGDAQERAETARKALEIFRKRLEALENFRNGYTG